ncbi:hypothetical protein PG985_014588 [Apiospora marii]|uniref:uncharacterized protein n=1 Tax=Apiospora marii TaxID=335849 RepID=UPI003130CCC1
MTADFSEPTSKNNMADSLPHKRSDGNTASDVQPNLTHLNLGVCVREDKYAKVYSVVSSEWASAQWEAHVFEMRGKKVRFFERMVWPKLRKSGNYEADFTRDATRIFVFRATEDAELIKASKTKSMKQREDLPTVALDIPNAEESGDYESTSLPNKTQLDPVAFVKKVLMCHCARMNEPTPRFKAEQVNADLPISSQPDFAPGDDFEKIWADLKRDASGLVDERGGNDAAPAKSFNQPPQLAGTGGRRRPRRGCTRPLPQDRDLDMILNLASMIKAEPSAYFPDGLAQLGRSFFYKHLWFPTARPTGSTLKKLVLKQDDWTDRLTRLIERIPKILKSLTKQRDLTWKSSIPRIMQVFGDIGHSDSLASHKTDSDSGWPSILRWMAEYGFEGLDPNEVQTLARSLSFEYTQTTVSWLLRIHSHVEKHNWASAELENRVDKSDPPDRILMQMLQVHTRRELVVGMLPLLERMRWVSGVSSKYWKCLAAYNDLGSILSDLEDRDFFIVEVGRRLRGELVSPANGSIDPMAKSLNRAWKEECDGSKAR